MLSDCRRGLHCLLIYCAFNLGSRNNYKTEWIAIIHTSLLSLLRPPLVVAWLQFSNRGYSSHPYVSPTPLHNLRLKTVCSVHRFLFRILQFLSWTVGGKVKIKLRPDGQSPSWPVCLCVKSLLRLKSRFLLQSYTCGFVDVGRWSSPAQSISGPSIYIP
jgi:hypothetical protein